MLGLKIGEKKTFFPFRLLKFTKRMMWVFGLNFSPTFFKRFKEKAKKKKGILFQQKKGFLAIQN